MKWEYWIDLFVNRHCAARGLSPRTIAAYGKTLEGFRAWVRFRLEDRGPDELAPLDIIEYVEHLRRERRNGPAAVNRQVTILRSFYRAIVAMGHLDSGENPMAHFPRIKAAPVKLPTFLSEEETGALLAQPHTDTVLGLRDRALLMVLYATGIRASECATMTEEDVDLENKTIRVIGKGGHERALPLTDKVLPALRAYRQARGRATPRSAFFRSRRGAGMSRNAIYERVRTLGQRARIVKRVTPHRLRHTFATHLMRTGAQLVVIRDMLGHRCLSSTQIYLHTTAQDMRRAADLHPVRHLVDRIADLLPNVRVPFQWLPGEKAVPKR
jgi:site-specific recombinase XerD